ncbi:MAG: hypothetical protein ACR2LA_09305 [Acidimicrobiales bacterium]
MAAFSFMWPPWWGWILAVVIVALGGIIATALSGPNMAAVGVTPDDRLLVRPVGLLRVWALSTGIDVPVTAIVDVGVSERRGLVKGLRAPGTYLPGVMTAGTFRSRGEKDLWMVGRADSVLVIELHDERYRHVIVQVEEPEAAVEALRAAMNRER